MKSLFILFVLIFAGFSNSYSQSTEKIPFGILKEDPKVDKLLDMVLNDKTAVKLTPGAKDLDSCFTMELFKGNDGSVAYQVKKVTKAVVNTAINQRGNRLGFGYFQYKKYHIIVWTDSAFSDLITKTSQTTTLEFVYKIEAVPSLKPIQGLATWHYLYDKGQFVVEGGPPPTN